MRSKLTDGGKRSGGSNGRRAGTTILALAALALTGCGTIPGLGGSAGAPQTSANVAQSARDQASVPGQSYGGHNYFNFASATPGEVTLRLIAYAEATGASLTDLTEALKATNGAPETVTITARDIQGGDADNAGAGAGGAGSGTGGAIIGERP